MTQKIIEVLLLFCAIFLASIFFILPFSRTHVFASPDESAVYAAAQAIAHTGSARASFAVLPEFPSLHPRSWVLQQGTLVPVGFLGLPILLALPSYLGNERGAMVAVAFLVVSAVFPLWQLSKRWGRVAQWISVFMYLTFPTVILYANRSLFPNLPATILTLWASYLFYRSERVVGILLSGILFAFALSVRPTEILWMTLWFVAACLVKRKEKKWQPKQLAVVVAGFCLGLIPFFVITRMTYGSFFLIGYWLRDPVVNAGQLMTINEQHAWPFGFHLSVLFFHVKHYVFNFFRPWTVFGGISLIFAIIRRRWIGVGVALGTGMILMLMYGQTIYQDHPGFNAVSLGNSFARYLLPLVIPLSFGMGYLTSIVCEQHSMRRFGFLTACMIIAGFGVSTAVVGTDESVVAVSQDLHRFSILRARVDELLNVLPPSWVVIGDRADKIAEGLPHVIVGSTTLTDADLAKLHELTGTVLQIGAPRTEFPKDASYCELPNGESYHWICLR